MGHHAADGVLRPAGEFPPAPPGNVLATGATGSWEGRPFQVLGRTVVGQGRAHWSEWCIRERDGSVHFISDAQGALHVLKMRGQRPRAPSIATLNSGGTLDLGNGETFQVVERNEAATMSVEGSVPFLATPGSRVAFVDLAAPGGALATLDWRDEGQPPDLWDGYPVTGEELGLSGGVRAETAVRCQGCATESPLHTGGAAVAFACPRCGTIHHREAGGWIRQGGGNENVGRRVRYHLRPGQRGKIRGETLRVAGSMQRHCVVEGETYYWREYFCVVDDARAATVEQRHRWLMEQDGHWNLIRPLPRGDAVQGEGSSIGYRGETFRLFSTVTATVDNVLGEHPWAVVPGESVVATDYIAPPRMVSNETSSDESFWTVGDHIAREEVGDAFGVRENLPWPEGVGPTQPNHTRQTAAWLLLLCVLFWIGIFIINTVVGATPARTLLAETSAAVAPPPVSDAEATQVDTAFYSVPFEVPRAGRNARLYARADLNNSWMTLDATLINEASGQVRGTNLSLEYYSGVEDGYGWAEGNTTGYAYFSDVPAGSTILRVDVECERKPCPPPIVGVEWNRPQSGYGYLLMFLLALWPGIAFARSSYMESERWLNSNV